MLRKEFPFDLIDAHFGYPEGVAAARLAERFGCPFVVTLRGNETLHGAAGRKRGLMSAALRKAAAVIGVSRRLCAFAVELGVEPERTHVIPNGVDSRTFHPRDRASARAALGMAEDRLHIVSAGYLIERKGHHHIVKALPSLRAAGLHCELWIIGEGGKEGDFEEAIRGAVGEHGLGGCVHMVGAVAPEKLAEYLSAADVFCLASNREGWPNVVNEALACGTPVVATDVGGVPDMLPGSEYGVVVQPESSNALLAGLKTALTRRWDGEAIAAWGAVRSWKKVAEETLEVLLSATEGAKR
jgi:glycosyltransferase involved in cell wall biosynthesis